MKGKSFDIFAYAAFKAKLVEVIGPPYHYDDYLAHYGAEQYPNDSILYDANQ